jgi:UDP-N-acetyl-D-mannosaminuronic acid dehydrogenase
LTEVLVLGLGEVGSALLEIVKGVYFDSAGYDIRAHEQLPGSCRVMHVCFPYSDAFVTHVLDYTRLVYPSLVLIESTVPPGTTRTIWKNVGSDVHVVHSPVRGRKADGFKWGLFNYTKFIGAADQEGAKMAEEYYKSLGFKTYVCSGPEEAEMAKMIDLAYFGLMLGWNQEMRRIAKDFHLNIDDVLYFLETNTSESGQRFPRPVYDGQPIGGHCVLSAVECLRGCFPSKFLSAVLESNDKRRAENG